MRPVPLPQDKNHTNPSNTRTMNIEIAGTQSPEGEHVVQPHPPSGETPPALESPRRKAAFGFRLTGIRFGAGTTRSSKGGPARGAAQEEGVD